MVFFDTNIFLYVVSAAEADQDKKRVAESLIASHDFGLSVQVIQEFMNSALNKKHLGLLPQEIEEMVTFMVKNPVVETSTALARETFRLKLRFHISYWDAAIVAPMSIRFGAFFGQSESFWYGLQMEYDFRALAKDREKLVQSVRPASELVAA